MTNVQFNVVYVQVLVIIIYNHLSGWNCMAIDLRSINEAIVIVLKKLHRSLT